MRSDATGRPSGGDRNAFGVAITLRGRGSEPAWLEPQWMSRCDQTRAEPDGTGSARTCWCAIETIAWRSSRDCEEGRAREDEEGRAKGG